MESLRIGISTQTPLVKLLTPPSETPSAAESASTELRATGQVPFEVNPGGVSRMVFQTARTWLRDAWAREIHWFSLQPSGPRNIKLDGLPITVHHLSLPPDGLAAYARTKERLWADIHGLPAERFGVEDFRFYTRYNAFTSDAILAQVPDLDAIYAHDFQLLQMGAMLGLAAPCVMRWHVPFAPERIPQYTRNFILRLVEDFDALIVSTIRDLHGFQHAGYRGHVRQVYPHIDPQDWPEPARAEVQQVEDELGLGSDNPVLLLVGRMDPIKRHDLAIRALARLRHHHPTAKLVLVGNGSFSSARQGGLGLSKADEWSSRLVQTADELGVQPQVIHAKWVPHNRLAALYQRANAVLLPSDLEGFGITVLEAWRYGKPVVVSKGAGSAEVVQPGINGQVFDPGDDDALGNHLVDILSSSEQAARMGEAGRRGLERFEATRKTRFLSDVFEDAIGRFRGP